MFQLDDLPPAAAAVLEQVRALPLDDAGSLTPDERAQWLVALEQIAGAVHAQSITVLGAFDAGKDGHTLHAARSTTAWLKGAIGVSGSEASERVHLARASRRCMSTSMKLLREGVITPEHIRTIERGIRHLPDEHREPIALVLNEAAERVDVEGLRQLIKHLNLAANPDGAAQTAKQLFNRRRLHLSPMLDGMVALDGVLDPVGAASLSRALEPFLVPSGRDDARNTPQRRADGLVELANVALSQTQLGVSGGNTPHLNVLCTLEGLTGRDAATGEAKTPRGRAQLGFTKQSGVVAGPTLDRISCNATLSRVLLNSESVPIALGRAKRLFTGDQRRLMAIRDGGCRFPDCGLPPAFTDGHHIIAWQDGGTTDLTNGLLVCRQHHRELHEGDWRIELNLRDTSGHRYADANQTLTFYRSSVIRGETRLKSAPANLTAHQLRHIAWWSNQPPDSS